MSRPDLDTIIQSPEAETFLRMVTKGFYDNSYTGLWLYEVIGREWDEMLEWAEGLKNEIHPQTCTWSIDLWELLYGIEPDEGLPLEYRRKRVLAKIVGVKPINPKEISRGVSALIGGTNGWVEVHDLTEPYRFELILHQIGDKPLNYANIFSFVRAIKPSHLAFRAAMQAEPVIFPNAERFQPVSLRLPFYFNNQPNDITLLNGRRRLDGSWKMDSGFRGLAMRSLGLAFRFSNIQNDAVLLNGRHSLDGSWQLNQTVRGFEMLSVSLFKMRLTNHERSVWPGVGFGVSMANRNSGSAPRLGFGSRLTERTGAMAGSLTRDTMWRLGGTMRLDGSRKLNAAVITENL